MLVWNPSGTGHKKHTISYELSKFRRFTAFLAQSLALALSHSRSPCPTLIALLLSPIVLCCLLLPSLRAGTD